MKKTEYARMAEREATYWWHLGRLKIIETYLRQATKDKQKIKILNVGCGTGGTLPLLEKYGTVDNVDVSDEALKFMKKLGYSRLTKVDGTTMPFKDNSYDIVVAFDVLEHIKDDAAALREWRRVLKPGGEIVMTVPAFQWLWSGHDVSLYHFRRYTTGRVRRLAQAAKLHPRRTSYAIVFSLPLIVGFRTLHKLTGKTADSETSYVDVPNWVNSLFTRFLGVEAWFHRYIRFWLGTSVIARLQKRA